MEDRGFNSFASNMIKLSVNETKWSSFLARTRTLIIFISIWILFWFQALKVTGTFEKQAPDHYEHQEAGFQNFSLFLLKHNKHLVMVL